MRKIGWIVKETVCFGEPPHLMIELEYRICNRSLLLCLMKWINDSSALMETHPHIGILYHVAVALHDRHLFSSFTSSSIFVLKIAIQKLSTTNVKMVKKSHN